LRKSKRSKNFRPAASATFEPNRIGVIEKVALAEPAGFDPPDKLDAFLDAVRWGAASTAGVKNIQPRFRSGIDIEGYQLDPVVRAIQTPPVNRYVADKGGMGTTGYGANP
jgi:hypothetical protein